MAEVTREMILDYMQAKGGVVKNVDLVRYFRKFLQDSDPRAKGKRELFMLRLLFFRAARLSGLLKKTGRVYLTHHKEHHLAN